MLNGCDDEIGLEPADARRLGEGQQVRSCRVPENPAFDLSGDAFGKSRRAARQGMLVKREGEAPAEPGFSSWLRLGSLR